MRFVVSSSRIIIRKSFESYFIIILSTRNVSVEILTTNDFKRVYFYWLSQLYDLVEVNLNHNRDNDIGSVIVEHVLLPVQQDSVPLSPSCKPR